MTRAETLKCKKSWQICWVAAGKLLNLRLDLLGEALCDGGVFTPGRDDWQLFGGDPERLGCPLPAAERCNGGHVCCRSEWSVCLSALSGTQVVPLRGGDTNRRSTFSQLNTELRQTSASSGASFASFRHSKSSSENTLPVHSNFYDTHLMVLKTVWVRAFKYRLLYQGKQFVCVWNFTENQYILSHCTAGPCYHCSTERPLSQKVNRPRHTAIDHLFPALTERQGRLPADKKQPIRLQYKKPPLYTLPFTGNRHVSTCLALLQHHSLMAVGMWLHAAVTAPHH